MITLLATMQLPVTYACAATPPVATPTSTSVQPSTPTPTPLCIQPTVTPPLQLMSGITVNQMNFINIQPGIVSIPLVCNRKKQWETGEPPLVVSTIECVLSTR
ncbi:unnamed protein product [Acanthocheilonema viteae]|uniref:C6 domain-containing protein n=1 Tax=Acanthocheilonema viteae TaxID=6277 RepID=A0A498SI59_ACAVI|nr:unnamed protein product [Acanthocheilonema viteae]